MGEQAFDFELSIGLNKKYTKIVTATTAGKAKYDYYLDVRDVWDIDFGEFIRCVRCRKLGRSVPALPELTEKLATGDKVQMVNCLEAEKYGDKVWTVASEPFLISLQECVMLEGYRGGFYVGFLQKVANG